MPKKSPFADEVGEPYVEIECRSGIVPPWHGSGDNWSLWVTLHLSHILMSFLLDTNFHILVAGTPNSNPNSGNHHLENPT